MPLRRVRRALVVALPLFAAAMSAPAAQAAVELRHTYAGPITPESRCTAEPRDAIYSNTTFSPALRTIPVNPTNLAPVDAVEPALAAGSVTDFCVAFAMTPDLTRARPFYTPGPSDPVDPSTEILTGEDIRDLEITLPPGFEAALKNVPTCSLADFGLNYGTVLQFATEDPFSMDPPDGVDRALCAANTQIGEAMARASVGFPGPLQAIMGNGQAGTSEACVTGCLTKTTWVYNLEPGPNELARIGLQFQHPSPATIYPIKAQVSIRLASDNSGRIVAVTRDLPRVLDGADRDLYTESVAIRMWGSPTNHPSLPGSFAQSGTSCTPASAGLSASTYGGPLVSDPDTAVFLPPSGTPTLSSMTTAPYTLTGCDQLPFAPAVDVQVAEREPGVPTAATVRVRVDQSAVGGRLPSHLKDASVTLPEGLALGGQVASDPDGLELCSAAEFAESDVTVAAACAASTQAATVAITSPLIDRQFTGKVFLGEPGSGGVLPQLFLEATLAGSSGAEAPRFKLIGSVTADADGRLTATFSDAPQLRWSELTLTFPGGDHALFSTAPRCGSTSGSARMSPWSGQPDVSVATSQVIIDQGCDAGFAPKVTVEPLDARAGKKSAVRITVERATDEPWLDALNVHLPSGFLADLNAAKECPAADAAVGNCSADSQIGTVQVLAGAGPAPLPLDGKMYLAERKGSDVAGAVIVTRAKVGDLDLGTVVVPGRILLRPTDAGLDFVTDVPLTFEGVALQLQKVVVNLDRPDFALNPSACGPLAFDAEITGDAGETAKPSGTVSYTGCKDLGFTPKLQAILTGDNTPGGHPGMFVVLTSPEGDAGMKSAVVTLPDGVVVDLQNAKNSCSTAHFNASACPASARIGTAKAQVSIIPEELTGAIYLVEIAGKSLPGLGLDFGGRYAQRVLGTTATNKDNRVVTSFASIPDLPLRRLTIDVTSSPKSPLQVSETSPCDANSGWEGAFVAQGGQSSTGRSGLQCAAKPKTLLSSKSGLSFRLFDFGTRNLSYLKLALPKGWSFNAKAAKRADALWVRATGGTAEIKLAKRSLFVYAKGKTTDVRFKISRSVINAPRKIKRGTKVNLPVRLAFTDGTIQQQAASITLK